MPMDRQRMADLLRASAASSVAAPALPLGARWLGSAEHRAGVESRWRRRTHAQLASTRELVDALRMRTYTDLSVFSADPLPVVAQLPLQALVPALVETIPTTKDAVRLVQELGETPVAAGGPPGTPLPESGLSFTQGGPGGQVAPTPVERFGVAWPVTLELLEDEGQVESLLESRLRMNFAHGLEALVLGEPEQAYGADAATPGSFPSPGSGPNGLGVFQAGANVPIIAKGGTDVYRLDAIARGSAAVQGAGWYTSRQAVVASPATLEAIVTEKSASNLYVFDPDLVPAVDQWIPSTLVPAGQAIVGSWFDAVVLFVKDGLALETSTEHEDYFTRGMVAMAYETRTLVWVRNPTALRVVTGL